MLPLAFFAVAGGLLFLVAGMTGSSLASVVKGHPDGANAVTPTGAAAGGETPAAQQPGATASGGHPGGAPGSLLAFATSQVGVPYKWGGELEKIAFDCSGLVQWSAGKAGIKLPRTAQEQYNATSRVAAGEAQAGDLVFFGSSPSNVSHVGIVVSPGVMLDATHTGANVEYSNFPQAVGSSWGSDKVIGYGRP